MNPKNLKNLPTEDVRDKLIRAVEIAADGWERARTGGGLGERRSKEEFEGPYDELVSRGSEGIEALLSLLRHPRAGVRMWAVIYAQYFAPGRSEPDQVLLDLASERGRIGAMAKRLLDEATEPDYVDAPERYF